MWQDGITNHPSEKYLQKTYGIGVKDWEAMFRAQKGRCANCGFLVKKLHVDHDHRTNKVRALLCVRCNQDLGFFEFVREKFELYLKTYGKGNPNIKQK